MVHLSKAFQTLVCVAVATVFSADSSHAQGQAGGVTAITGVAVIPMDRERVLTDQTVILTGGKIAAMGPTRQVQVPVTATRVDGRGKYLLPGFSDMHVHLTAGPNRANGTSQELARVAEFLGMFLDAGVTTVRDMAGGPFTLAVRRALNAGQIEGPRVVLASAVLETNFTFPAMASFAHRVPDPAAGRAEVRAAKRAGYDFIKVYNRTEARTYHAIMDEARRLRIPVAGHVPFDLGVPGVLKARQRSIEHLRGYDFALDTRPPGRPFERYVGWLHTDAARMQAVAKATARSRTWNVPTLVTNAAVLTDEQLKTYTPSPDLGRAPAWLRQQLEGRDLQTVFSAKDRETTQAALPFMLKFTKLLQDEGARLVAGTDTPALGLVPGYSLHDELKLFVQAGLTPYQALHTATLEPARLLANERISGTVAVGKSADLVLLEANPLADISATRRIAGVFVAGKWRPAKR